MISILEIPRTLVYFSLGIPNVIMAPIQGGGDEDGGNGGFESD